MLYRRPRQVCILDRLHGSGYTTEIDLGRITDAARMTKDTVGRDLPGQVLKAGPRLRRYDPQLTATAEG